MTMPLEIGITGGLTCGRGSGSPTCSRYDGEFPFTGVVHHAVVDVSGEMTVDKESEMRAVMARQ